MSVATPARDGLTVKDDTSLVGSGTGSDWHLMLQAREIVVH